MESEIADAEVQDCDLSDAKESPLSSAWYGGDQSIVSYGDAIAEDLCRDNLTQLEYNDDEHEAEVEESFIRQDCAFDDAKEYEVENGGVYEMESCDADVEDLLYDCDADVEDLLYY